jgi:unsaturated chondroitin disaccharide hydrolase
MLQIPQMIELSSRPPRALLEHALEVAARQTRRLIDEHPGFYPMYTREGRWKHSGEAWTHWCDGFFPGIMWIVAKRDSAWLGDAIRYSKPLEPRQFDRDVHDLGFIFMSTYKRWLDLTDDAALNDVLIQAGRTMGLRFRPKGQYLRSFVSEDSLFIDIMMNVGIIFRTALETGDERLYGIADLHCLTTRRVLVRGDGSTAHEGLFDIETGEFLKQTTHQGWRGDSCWSRGLAWALYGFGTVYGYTRDRRFLATAEYCADYYVTHTPGHGVPPWDYDAPTGSAVQVDTSAAAIAASGLFQLAEQVADPVKGAFYRQTAETIIGKLCREYLADPYSGWEGILKGGVYHIHKGLGVNESVMWGEYFFVEAVDKALAIS